MKLNDSSEVSPPGRFRGQHMADNNNNKIFTAADIENYHKGLLSSKERHELEKAALDDPFLADALEGYSTAGVNAVADIAELRKRLSEKTKSGKVLQMSGERRTTFTWLKVASLVVIMAGAGLLVYQFAFNKKSESIAQNQPEKNKEAVSKDSGQTAAPVISKTDEKNISTETVKNTDSKQKLSANKIAITIQNISAKQKLADTVSYTSGLVNKNYVASAPNQPVINNGVNPILNDKKVTNDEIAALNQLSKSKIYKEKDNAGNVTVIKKLQATDEDRMKTYSDNNQNAMAFKTNRTVSSNPVNANLLHNNIFRGRVLDDNNNPLPFANITNTSDSIGTYADAKGYFNFISPDSVMNVEVRSLGFNNTNTQLRNNVLNNQVILQENKNLDEVVISHKKINAERRSHDLNMKVEEPEPADGWGNYDVYLANNLKVPETIREKQEYGEVEVSLEVDKNGEPVNIKVEKSLCNECDKEAIRLIKEGPKWKHKTKKGRARVTVSF